MRETIGVSRPLASRRYRLRPLVRSPSASPAPPPLPPQQPPPPPPTPLPPPSPPRRDSPLAPTVPVRSTCACACLVLRRRCLVRGCVCSFVGLLHGRKNKSFFGDRSSRVFFPPGTNLENENYRTGRRVPPYSKIEFACRRGETRPRPTAAAAAEPRKCWPTIRFPASPADPFTTRPW